MIRQYCEKGGRERIDKRTKGLVKQNKKKKAKQKSSLLSLHIVVF